MVIATGLVTYSSDQTAVAAGNQNFGAAAERLGPVNIIRSFFAIRLGKGPKGGIWYDFALEVRRTKNGIIDSGIDI